MIKKTLIPLLLLAIFASITFGCSKGTPSDTPDIGVNDIEYDSGGEEMTNINMKSIAIEQKDGTLEVAIGFVHGDENSSVAETPAESVPYYKAYILKHPSRFVVEFSSIDYWAYDRTVNIADNDAYFYDIFKQFQINDNRFRIIFQLRKDADVKVSDNESELKLTFSNFTDYSDQNYSVVTDALTAYDTGELETSGLFPTLCDGLTDKVLISKPFSSEAEAQVLQKSLFETYRDILNTGNTFVIAHKGNELPNGLDSNEYATVYSQNIIRRDGVEQTLPVVVPDGMYLCSTDDGYRSVFYKQLHDDVGDTTQQLWITDADEKFKLLNEIEFSSITSAKFSPDGKKLAFIEQTTDSSYLYIYDMETNAIDNLGEQGLGIYTGSFIWDPLSTALYAISGDESQQLLKYDFTIPDETARISPVEEQKISQSDLGFFNGELYFADVAEDAAAQSDSESASKELIFKIKPEGGLRTEFAQGSSFKIASGGNYMAILSASVIGDEESSTSVTTLKLKDMTTGVEALVLENEYIIAYNWSVDQKIYYTVAIDESLSLEYSFELRSYDVASKKHTVITEMSNSDFFTTPDPNIIYIPLIKDDDNENIRATYKFVID